MVLQGYFEVVIYRCKNDETLYQFRLYAQVLKVVRYLRYIYIQTSKNGQGYSETVIHQCKNDEMLHQFTPT